MPARKETPANRQDLIALVAKERDLSIAQATKTVDCVLASIIKLTDNYPYLQINSFGSFHRRLRKAKVNKAPIEGGPPLEQAGYWSIAFKASKTLKQPDGEDE